MKLTARQAEKLAEALRLASRSLEALGKLKAGEEIVEIDGRPGEPGESAALIWTLGEDLVAAGRRIVKVGDEVAAGEQEAVHP